MTQVEEQMAIRLASEALTKIDSHLRVCDTRYAEQQEQSREARTAFNKMGENMGASLGRIHERIDKVLWTVGGAVILYLVSAVGYLLPFWTPWKQ